MIKILEQRALYRQPRFHAAFPSILRFTDDRLLLAFRRARDGLWLIPEGRREGLDPLARMDHIDSRSHIALLELEPDGTPSSAEPELLPMDPEAADQDPSLLLLPDGQVFLSSFSWYPLPSDAAQHLAGRRPPGDEYAGCRFLFWGSHANLRDRQPHSWVYHHGFIPPDGGYGRSISPDGSKQLIGANRGSALWHGGEILLAVYGNTEEGAALFASADLGRHWQLRGIIAQDATAKLSYQEPALCRDEQGGLIAFLRTGGGGGRLASCRSSDGRHWSEPVLHQLIGHPFHPLPLADGRLLLTYGYRSEPFGIRARLLDRPSANPDDFPEIILRADGTCPDLGYPWAVQLADGRVLVCYYLTDSSGIRHIAGSWLELD
jgi:hypothetical protein